MSIFAGLDLNNITNATEMTPTAKTMMPSETPQIDSVNVEYVNVTLPSGEQTRFNRVWGGHRFTDEEVQGLMLGYDVIFDTVNRRGVCGSLDWATYEEHDYYGFVPWGDEAYSIENAPFPIKWNNHTFTAEEEIDLRKGHKVLVVCTSKQNGSLYAVHVTFELQTDTVQEVASKRWVIVPHFDEFEQDALEFTREDCLFLPVFCDKQLTHNDIKRLRKGSYVRFKGVNQSGRTIRCHLSLELEEYRGNLKWRLVPDF